ncbi:chemotaxis-specific protein-glutamate methyltransferase CheB [Anaerocolumna sedimenticola]|uniref:Protein-glutamate methylesterase/protein-glutamine glutaminase n=1 Tax=Anaerocolumna sedimenticola TaxID=2696063 RepID=A0A6P1TV94_9FIRM|nr:chemotaxis response regulator protein-glutamate methylesterase [Anaerocolumna sedimenticola]QHQ63355.1 chemotaxis-specific protein-glutamate methyltransferase CheB [Anaerocolumna sedimenticola]
MENRKKIRVMIVDDSIMFREVIKRGISSDPLIEVVALARDPFEARDKILNFHPDVITCDVEMPRMNGIEFVRRLLPQYFAPIIMVSSVSNAVFEAMEAGAIDFVVKPDIQSTNGVEEFICDLVQKIKTASMIKNPSPGIKKAAIKVPDKMIHNADTIIAIGASTGGTEAIYSILRSLPPTIPGIVITQHIPPVFSKMFAERLNSQTSLKVKEAETGDYADQGTVLIAPGDRHMRIKKIGRRYQVECFHGEKVNGHCPSVDVLFHSVAKEACGHAVGIILTGMGQDGAKGLLAMRYKGSRTIGQDEESSIVYGMPMAAFDIGAVEKQAALGNIPQVLLDMIG